MNLTRRELLSAATGTLVASTLASSQAVSAAEGAGRPANAPFGYMLNTSTIRGQKLGIVANVEIAAKAGYDAIEPWINELDQYVKDGGSLPDLGKRIKDAGLTVESAIGFAQWIVDDDEKRAKGLEEAKRNMDMLVAIGGKRLAAPPVGAHTPNDPVVDLKKAGERYRALCDIGDQIGIVAQVEVWGFSKNLSRLSESMYVAFESGHPKACLLADAYHLHKGGSDFNGMKLVASRAMHVFHINDYPGTPERAAIKDADRVYPGDGVAPLSQLYRDLRDGGFRGYLSLELFNPEYWKQDAQKVATTGLEKIKATVAKGLG
jgi:2-keto-myo-inositol isomerase